MKLPPLQSLRVFEAVARLGSMTAAGEELFVSHSAVSHQMRKLEEWLAIPLVERYGRGIRLTEAGERYRSSICEAFRRIHEETDLLRRQQHATRVRVSALPMFAVSWLLPQMHDFWGKHPDIQIALHYSRGTMEIDPAETDIAIRFGQPGDYVGFVAMPLLEGAAMAVASPDYLARAGYRSFADVSRLTFLHDEFRDFWGLWLKRAGLDPRPSESGVVYPDGNLALAATMAGEGVGLLRRALIEPQLRSGSLVAISDFEIQENQNYLVLTPANRPVPRSALIFVQWLQSLPGTIRLGVPRP